MYNEIYNRKQINPLVWYDCNLVEQQRIRQDFHPSYNQTRITPRGPLQSSLKWNLLISKI